MFLNSVMLIHQVRIVDFFAAFVREFMEIIKASLPLASMLFSIVFVQGVCFYILAENTEDGEKLYKNIWMAWTDSYRLTLGDFEVAETFANTTTPILFWILFVVGTIISLLVLLNMVIAVMGSSFQRVQLENTAQIYREKLKIMVENSGSYPE